MISAQIAEYAVAGFVVFCIVAWAADKKGITAWFDSHVSAATRKNIGTLVTEFTPAAKALAEWLEEYGPAAPLDKFATGVKLLVAELEKEGVVGDVETWAKVILQGGYDLAKKQGTLPAVTTSTVTPVPVPVPSS